MSVCFFLLLLFSLRFFFVSLLPQSMLFQYKYRFVGGVWEMHNLIHGHRFYNDFTTKSPWPHSSDRLNHASFSRSHHFAFQRSKQCSIQFSTIIMCCAFFSRSKNQHNFFLCLHFLSRWMKEKEIESVYLKLVWFSRCKFEFVVILCRFFALASG